MACTFKTIDGLKSCFVFSWLTNFQQTSLAEFITSFGAINDPGLFFTLAAVSILGAPLIWNIAARQNYHNRWLNKMWSILLFVPKWDPMAERSKKGAAYSLALWIFSFSLVRDLLFQRTIEQQPILVDPFSYELFSLIGFQSSPSAVYLIVDFAIAYVCIFTGFIFVVSSMWQLGITGTYLGDYCGILMKDMVTGFPFNFMVSPMYTGSTLSFLGFALKLRSPAGLLLAVFVWICYKVALRYEDSFTTSIYEKIAQKQKTS